MGKAEVILLRQWVVSNNRFLVVRFYQKKTREDLREKPVSNNAVPKGSFKLQLSLSFVTSCYVIMDISTA